MKKRKVTLSLDDKIYSDFQKYCEENAIMLSKKIELVMRDLLKNGKKLSVFIMLFSLLFLQLNFASALERGGYWNKINNSDGSYSLEIYNNIINMLNGLDYIPISPQIESSSYLNFIYEVTGTPYKVYFRNNSNTAEAVRFEKDGYFFVYEISDGVIQWREQPGFPERTDTLGGGAPSNSQDSFAVIDNNVLTYPDAFYNTNVTYILSNDMLKENFILSGLPSFKDYLYLEYTGKVYFNRSLKICANNLCYIPSGTEDDFYTSGKIEFKDENNLTIFYLKEPVITDSNGTSILGIYYIHGSDAQMGFDLRINKTFLETAVFPIYIDPSISIDITEGGKDSYIIENKDKENHGNDGYLEVDSEETGKSERTLLEFNLSEIPPDSIIESATLELYYTKDNGEDFNLSVYRLTQNWTESGVTWDAYDGINSWVTAGGDYDSYEYSKTFIDSNLGWKYFDLQELIQDFVDGTENYGFILVPTPLQAGNNYKQFASKENTNVSATPRLIINYTNASDTTPPEITINSPLNNTFNYSTPNLNITIVEDNIDSVWISLDNGKNITYSHENGTIDFGYLDLIFADDFGGYEEGSNASPVWETLPWFEATIIENKTYKLYNETALIDALASLNNSFSELDYWSSAKVMVPNYSNGSAYLCPRFKDVNDKYEIALDYDWSSININKVVSSSWSNLDALWTGDLPTPIYVSKNEWHILGLRVNEDRIYAYVDGQEALNVTDSDLSYTGFSLIALDDVDTHTSYFDDLEIHKELTYGEHILRVYANDTFGNENYTEVSFFINVSEESSPPSFSSYTETPDNGSVYFGGFYEFNVTITDDNLDSAGIEFNGINYSVNNLSDVFTFNIMDLAAGTYDYYWWANDTINYNVSETKEYIVSKAVSTTNLVFDKTPPKDYGTTINASCYSNNPEASVNLYRDGITINSENGKEVILAAGTYNYECNITETENYTSATNFSSFIINQASQTASLNINESSPITYENYINVSCNGELFRDDINVSLEIGEQILLGAGTYKYSCKLYEDQNYSYDDDNSTFIVNQFSSSVNLVFSPSSPQAYETLVNASCSTDNLEGTPALYRDDLEVTTENGLEILLAGGNHQYVCNVTGGQNYTFASDSGNFVINKAPGDVILLLNGLEADLLIQYPQQVNASASTTKGNITLYRDEADVTIENGLDVELAVGYYNYTAVSSGNENYTEVSVTYFINLTKANVSLNLTSDGGWVVDYLQTTYVNCSSSYGPVSLELDGISAANPYLTDLSAGSFEFNCSFAGDENYSANLISNNLVVNKIQMPINLYIDDIEADKEITYGSETNASGFKDYSEGILKLYKEGVEGSNPDIITLGVGYYNYTLIYEDTENFTYNSKTFFLNVTKASSSVYLYLNHSREDIIILESEGLEINSSLQEGEGDVLVYQDSDLIYSGIPPSYNLTSFSPGFYNITAIYSETENYTGSSETFYVNVTAIPDLIDPVVNIFFPENSEYNYSELELNFSVVEDNLDTCWKSINQGENITISCYENSTINSPEVIEGLNFITLYANDTSGNLGFDSKVFIVSIGQDFDYSLTAYPLEYLFAAREAADEINSFEISLYDNSNLTILVDISYEMQENNFSFLTSPLSVYLNDSDSPENPIRLNVSIQANSGIENGTYNGTITLNVSLTGINETVDLVYGINPPSGIPKIYSPVDEECVNEFSPLGCSDAFIINQDSSYTLTYKAVNNGTYPLEECYIRNSLNWTTFSLSNFLLNVSEAKEFSVTYSPTALQEIGVYYDQIYIDCIKGDSLGNRVMSPPGNRPMNKIMLSEKSVNVPNNGRGGSSGGIPSKETIKDLEIENLPDLIVNLGESKKMTLSVKNNGTIFLNECKLRGKGDNSWISSEGSTGLGEGEEHEFIINLKVPLELDKGVYDIEFDIICNEFNKSSRFSAEILENKLAVDIINVERERDKLKITYSLAELSGFDQEVEVEAVLFDGNNRLASTKELRIIEAELKKSFETTLDISPDLKGNFNLLVTAKSKSYSTFTQEEVVLGGSIGGLAILDDAQRNKYISIALLIIFLAFAIFIAIKMINHKRFKKRIGIRRVKTIKKA